MVALARLLLPLALVGLVRCLQTSQQTTEGAVQKRPAPGRASLEQAPDGSWRQVNTGAEM
jgi:hypothetical protein